MTAFGIPRIREFVRAEPVMGHKQAFGEGDCMPPRSGAFRKSGYASRPLDARSARVLSPQDCRRSDRACSTNSLFRTGWAVARRSETTDYVAVEAEAKEKKLGLWQGEFMMPDAFRRAAGIFVNRP